MVRDAMESMSSRLGSLQCVAVVRTSTLNLQRVLTLQALIHLPIWLHPSMFFQNCRTPYAHPPPLVPPWPLAILVGLDDVGCCTCPAPPRRRRHSMSMSMSTSTSTPTQPRCSPLCALKEASSFKMTFALVVSAATILATMPVKPGRIVLPVAAADAWCQGAAIGNFSQFNSTPNGIFDVCDEQRTNAGLGGRA